MRYLFFFSSSPLSSGFFGLSLRSSAFIFGLYQILLRAFVLTNVILYLDKFGFEANYVKFAYVYPTRIVLLINNSIFLFALLWLLVSTCVEVSVVIPFLSNVVCAVNVLINIMMNTWFIFIERPQIDFRFKYYERYISGYIFIYITVLEIILQYILHSFCMNYINDNKCALDYPKKYNQTITNKEVLRTMINTENSNHISTNDSSRSFQPKPTSTTTVLFEKEMQNLTLTTTAACSNNKIFSKE